MGKRHADRQLIPLLEGRLTRDDRVRTLEHLAECPRCRKRYETLRTSLESLPWLPAVKMPAARAESVRREMRRRLRQRSAARPLPGPRWVLPAWRWVVPVTAVMLLAVGLSFTWRLQAAQDWPQWRGPHRDGKSPATGLVASWPVAGPTLLWKAEGLGRGYASVAVAGGRVFTMGDLTASGEVAGQYAVALDEDDGRLLWRTRVGPAWRDRYQGPRATPAVASGRIYVLTTEGVLIALDAATGELRWRRDLPVEYDGALMQWQGRDWRWSESPLVDGDRVIVTPGAPGAALVAFDKFDGRELWRAAIPDLGEHGADGAGYSSAVISSGGGVRQVVQFLGRGLVGVEASTGRFLWGYNEIASEVANIATPIARGDHVFAATGFGSGAVLLELVPVPDGGVEPREVYRLGGELLPSRHGGGVLEGGHLYFGGGQRGERPLCLEFATGRLVWGPTRRPSANSAALVHADGRLYLRRPHGQMVLAEVTPMGYEERGSFEIPGAGGEGWSHPVIAGGRLFVREQGELFVYDLRQSG